MLFFFLSFFKKKMLACCQMYLLFWNYFCFEIDTKSSLWLKSKILWVFHALAHTLPPNKDYKLLVRTPAPGACQNQARSEQIFRLARRCYRAKPPPELLSRRLLASCSDFWVLTRVHSPWFHPTSDFSHLKQLLSSSSCLNREKQSSSFLLAQCLPAC